MIITNIMSEGGVRKTINGSVRECEECGECGECGEDGECGECGECGKCGEKLQISSLLLCRTTQLIITEKLRYKAFYFKIKKRLFVELSVRMRWRGLLAISNQPREEKKSFELILFFIRRGNYQLSILDS